MYTHKYRVHKISISIVSLQQLNNEKMKLHNSFLPAYKYR